VLLALAEVPVVVWVALADEPNVVSVVRSSPGQPAVAGSTAAARQR
jgi:hypothetical protein